MNTENTLLVEHNEIRHNNTYEIGQSVFPLCTARSTLILDLRNVSYIDSSGLSFLFKVHRELAKKNGTLLLAHVCQQISATFQLTNMNKIFNIRSEASD